MVHFKLFGFPVRIHYFFWILCIVLGMNNLQLDGRAGIIMLFILTATVLVSVLWHELGHAFFRKKYGAPYSEITLWGMGGLCSGPGRFTRKQRVAISAAGPFFNFILGGLIFLLTFTPYATNPLVDQFIYWGLFINIGWGILNLLPILPLDGGRILEALVSRKHEWMVPWIGLVLAVMAAICGGITGRIFAAIIFGLIAYENWKMIAGRTYRGA